MVSVVNALFDSSPLEFGVPQGSGIILFSTVCIQNRFPTLLENSICLIIHLLMTRGIGNHSNMDNLLADPIAIYVHEIKMWMQ